MSVLFHQSDSTFMLLVGFPSFYHAIIASWCPHLHLSNSCVCVCMLCEDDPANTCLLPMEEGSCGRYTMRWYFNSEAQACRPFIYSGCQGNENRFLDLEECEEVCLGGAKGVHAHARQTLYSHTQTHI